MKCSIVLLLKTVKRNILLLGNTPPYFKAVFLTTYIQLLK